MLHLDCCNYPVIVFESDDEIPHIFKPYMEGDYLQALAVIKARGKSGIFVNRHFLNLTNRQQEALLAHEVGHLELKHAESNAHRMAIEYQLAGLNQLAFNIRCEMEYEADAFAARQGYRDELIEIMTNDLQKGSSNAIAAIAFRYRIEMLQKDC
jgi:Zn-dependent protease with chaperone function